MTNFITPGSVLASIDSSAAVLYDSTLSGDAATISSDTLPPNYRLIEILVLARTSEAVDISTILIRFNNDSSSLYDLQHVSGANAVASAAQTLIGSSWTFNVTGNSAEAGAVALVHATFPSYDQTTFHKQGVGINSVPDDTAANNRVRSLSLRYKSTTAVSSVSVTAGSGNLKAGSRLLVLGR